MAQRSSKLAIPIDEIGNGQYVDYGYLDEIGNGHEVTYDLDSGSI